MIMKKKKKKGEKQCNQNINSLVFLDLGIIVVVSMSLPMMHNGMATAEAAMAGTTGSSMSRSAGILDVPVSSNHRRRRLPQQSLGVRDFFSMQHQGARNVNIGKAHLNTKTSTLDDSNKPTVTSIYPKVWSIPGSPYHKQITTGDILFAVNGEDSVPDNRSTNRYVNQRTVINLQQLNKELITGKARATSAVLSAMVAGRFHTPVINPSYPDIDLNWLFHCVKQQEELNEFGKKMKVHRRLADKIMERDVALWEDQVRILRRGLEVDDPSPALVVAQNIVQQIYTDYDSHLMHTDSQLSERYQDLMKYQMYFLFPKFVHEKYSFIGTVEDALNPSEFHRQKRSLQGGITVAVRGPAKCMNIFGEPKRKRSRRMPRSDMDDGNMYLLGQLHIALCTPPSLASMFRTPDGRGSFHMWPIVALPTCVADRSDLIAKLDNDSLTGGPLACYNFNGKYIKHRTNGRMGNQYVAKNDGFDVEMVYTSEKRSWFLGTILAMEPSPNQKPNFYKKAVGCIDYTDTGGTGVTFNDVIEMRKVVRQMTINVKSK